MVDLRLENERARERIRSGASDRLDYAALAYTIHNIYCLMENCFLRIAKTFENHLDADAWHRDLVRRMSIPIEAIRPALLDDETAGAVDELRAFRHVFRNVYQNPLKPKKVLELDDTVADTVQAFTADCETFIATLRAMIADY
ncbi:MAG: hypothetical protein Q8M76_07490 [Spirochaetaceae bacterium]|nr:hypothetical protein [Spirochaetaceae bacterium]